VDDYARRLEAALQSGRTIAIVTILTGPTIGRKLLLDSSGAIFGSLGDSTTDDAALRLGRRQVRLQQAARALLPTNAGEVDAFIDVIAPPPKLIIVGAVHIAIPLVTFGNTLGFETIVLDARSAFATPERFPHAGRLVVGWPADSLTQIGITDSTYITVLTHDEKIDNPALAVALRSPARYIGALGSRKTHARRVAALTEQGLTPSEIERIHNPIGLSIGARLPEEIAVAIIAEIVAMRNSEPSLKNEPNRPQTHIQGE
jgi:xanthine dehydrogenase accessory factor